MQFQLKIEKKNRLKTLILENCLIFGQHPKFTNKKITKYLLGTRRELEVFRVQELEHILLKIYPFIQTLFKNVQKKLKFNRHQWQKEKKLLKPMRTAKKTVTDFHLLFVTTSDLYRNITASAAAFCQISTDSKEGPLQCISSSAFRGEATT
jgi:hypothetical protein